jgi:hypothetical protein
MTKQALTALTDAAPSNSAADASAIASADSTMTEGDSHHGAAIIVTEQALTALADAARSNSAADASAIASADSTMTECDSHHGAAVIVRVSQVNGCFWLSSSICWNCMIYELINYVNSFLFVLLREFTSLMNSSIVWLHLF